MAEAGPSNAGAKDENMPSHSRRPVSLYVEDRVSRLSDEEAERALDRVIGRTAQAQGFDGIEGSAMDYIKTSMQDMFEALVVHTQELSIVSRRTDASVRDAYIALQQQIGPRMRPNALRRYAEGRRLKPEATLAHSKKGKRTSDWLSPSDDWLPSDEEEDEVGQRRRKPFRPLVEEIPAHLPDFPPKHTWLATPSFPIRQEDILDPLTYLDIKVLSTRTTEFSLRGLISATDAASNVKSTQDSRSVQPVMSASASTGSLFKTDVFSKSAGVSPRISLSADASSASIPPISATSPVTPDEDSRKSRRAKPISLRLRTSSSAHNIAVGTPPAGGAKDLPSNDRPAAAGGGRASISFPTRSASGVRLPTPLASPALTSLRRGTTGGGTWTALPSQSYFTWGPPTPGVGYDTPLATPLTPGGFVYPPTPASVYAPGAPPFDATNGTQFGDDDANVELALPGVVNYKRSWYRKNDSAKKDHAI